MRGSGILLNQFSSWRIYNRWVCQALPNLFKLNIHFFANFAIVIYDHKVVLARKLPRINKTIFAVIELP